MHIYIYICMSKDLNICSYGSRRGGLARAAPSKRRGPVGGEGKLALASWRQAARKDLNDLN